MLVLYSFSIFGSSGSEAVDQGDVPDLPDYTSVDARLGVEVSRFRIEAYLPNMFGVRGQLSANTAYSILGTPRMSASFSPGQWA